MAGVEGVGITKFLDDCVVDVHRCDDANVLNSVLLNPYLHFPISIVGYCQYVIHAVPK